MSEDLFPAYPEPVKPFLRLGLRQAAILVSAFFVALLISQGAQQTAWFKDRLFRQLVTGTENQQLRAVSLLAEIGAETHLLKGLQAGNEQISEMARRGLDHLWFNAAGKRAYALMEQAYDLTEKQEYAQALKILDLIVERYPSYAEAWNRRAAVLWQLGDYEKSRRDCERALSLNPNHYGAWQGLGVSQLQLGQLDEACRSLRSSLRIAPNDKVAQRCLKKCEDLMRKRPHNPSSQSPAELL